MDYIWDGNGSNYSYSLLPNKNYKNLNKRDNTLYIQEGGNLCLEN